VILQFGSALKEERRKKRGEEGDMGKGKGWREGNREERERKAHCQEPGANEQVRHSENGVGVQEL